MSKISIIIDTVKDTVEKVSTPIKNATSGIKSSNILEDWIPEVMVLVVTTALLFSNKIGMPEETVDLFRKAFWIVIGFIFAKGKK